MASPRRPVYECLFSSGPTGPDTRGSSPSPERTSPTAHVAVSAPRAQSGPRDIYDTEPVVVLPVEDVRRELVAGVHTVGEPLEVDAPLDRKSTRLNSSH